MSALRKFFVFLPLFIAGVAVVIAFTLKQKYAKQFAEEDARAAAEAKHDVQQVVSLYYPQQGKAAGEVPLGIHVADVGVSAVDARLLGASQPDIAETVGKALVELNSQPSLPLPAGVQASTSAAPAAASPAAAKPGDPKYAWAAGDFLQARLGWKYQVHAPTPAEPAAAAP